MILGEIILYQLFYLLLKQAKNTRSSHWRRSIKKAALKNFANFTGKHFYWSRFFIRPATLLKETRAQVFYGGICEIFKNTYFEEHLRTTVSGILFNFTYLQFPALNKIAQSLIA